MSQDTKGSVEWGIVHRLSPDDLHRGPMTEEQARDWVREWVEDGGVPEAFLIVRRAVHVTPWEVQ